MKILFLVSQLWSGGAERTVAYLSKYIVAQGHDVIVLSIQDNIFYELDERVKLTVLGIPGVSLSPRTVVPWIINHIKRPKYVCRAIRDEQPDVVFCIHAGAAKSILRQHKHMKYTLITSERTLPQILSKKDLRTKKTVFLSSDGVVFQTKRAMDFYEEAIKQKGKVIANAVGNPYVYQATPPVTRRKVIAAMGRLTKGKDYPTLLSAFAMVQKKHPDFSLEIYGTGPEQQNLLQLAESLGIASSVHFCGASPDAILRIQDASCYVLSSLYEGMPNALMEAMAVGLPCVSTDCPNGPAELIDHGKNGLLVPVGDKEKMAEAILQMIEQPDFAAACQLAAKQILETHSMDKNATEYLRFICDVMSKSKQKNDE